METKRADSFASAKARCSDSVTCTKKATLTSQWRQSVHALPQPSCPIDIPSPHKRIIKKSRPLMLDDSFFYNGDLGISKNTYNHNDYKKCTPAPPERRASFENSSSFSKTDDNEMVFFFESDSGCRPPALKGSTRLTGSIQYPGLSLPQPAQPEHTEEITSAHLKKQNKEIFNKKTQYLKSDLPPEPLLSNTPPGPSSSLLIDTGYTNNKITPKTYYPLQRQKITRCVVPQSLPDSSFDSDEYEPHFIQSLDDSF